MAIAEASRTLYKAQLVQSYVADMLADAVVGAVAASAVAPLTKPAPCDSSSPIFCQGELLRIVQLAAIYPDSKTFVDKKVRDSPEETLQRFHELLRRTAGEPGRDDVLAFVDQSFEVSQFPASTDLCPEEV